MFGHHKMTHEGSATIVSLSDARHHMTWTSGGYTHSKYDLVVDVYPVGAPAFRAEAEASFAILLSPNPGDTVAVRCNPEERAVELAVDDDPRFNVRLHAKAVKEASKRQHE